MARAKCIRLFSTKSLFSSDATVRSVPSRSAKSIVANRRSDRGGLCRGVPYWIAGCDDGIPNCVFRPMEKDVYNLCITCITLATIPSSSGRKMLQRLLCPSVCRHMLVSLHRNRLWRDSVYVRGEKKRDSHCIVEKTQSFATLLSRNRSTRTSTLACVSIPRLRV